MNEKFGPPELEEILASLGQELRRPLDALQGEIVRLLIDPERPISDAQRSHTQTMLALCEDLRKLTVECLGEPPLGREHATEPT
jgi:signal transduction histidine kinase